jgi:RND family efflux transporter MFP subunit
LERLRIKRDEEPLRLHEGRRIWPWVVVGVVLVLAAAGGGWWRFVAHAGIPVHVAIAKEAPGGSAGVGTSALDASGYVVARREATVSAKTTGRVLDVLIEEGQKVSENQILAHIDDSNSRAALEQARASLLQAEASLDAARISMEDARPIYERNERQRAANVISAQDFDASKATYNAQQTDYAVKQRMVDVARATLAVAQRNEDDTIVRAPFTGVVTVKAAQQGEIVSPVSAGGAYTRTGICTIVDMDSLEVEVDVSENFINRVRPGQAATARLNAYPDWEIPASVIAIIPTADRSKATVKVRVGFKQKDARILPDMGVRVSFLTETPSAATAVQRATIVPADAVQANGDSGTVFVIDGDTVERREVRLGVKTNDGQTILSGLSAGTRVAIGDFGRLSDNTRISIQP